MKKKITLVGPVYPYRGGIAYFNTRLSKELFSVGYQAQIISFLRQYPSWLYPGKSDKDPSREHISVEAQYILDPLHPWTWFISSQKIREFQPRFVFFQWWTSFWGPAFYSLSLLLRYYQIPTGFIIHNVMPHETRFFDRWIAKFVLSQASAWITLSPQENQRLHTLLPNIKSYLGSLPLHQLSQSRMSQSDARQKLGISEEEFVILFFGIIRPYKGLGLLIEAINLLAKQNIRPYLIIAGEFWENEIYYRKMIETFQLRNQIRIDNRFVPNEEAHIYFSAADLFVAPYLSGTQSGAIKTAMDYRLPVVASDKIATDLLKDKFPIYVFPSGDSEALANTLKTAINQPRQAHINFGADNSWSKLIELLNIVVNDVCGKDNSAT